MAASVPADPLDASPATTGCEMNLPPFPDDYIPTSPEARRRLIAWGEECARQAAIDAGEQDAERLDWLERQDLMDIVFGFVVDAAHDGEYAINAGRGLFYGKTLRAAIDAARAA